MAEPILQLREVTRRFGEVTAVNRLSLTLHEGEFVTLLGPSGCGKTTALRLIAGFEFPDEGEIVFRGTPVTAWTPQRRGFGMVFQNYALFPHLNVFENVAFGLRSRKRPDDEIRERVAASLERVDLAGYGERAVQALSGGQQQRVSLARALAIEPPILLLDEPLSNLDQALRVRTRTELRRLVKELGITALFVTHDQEEAFDLSDRIAVMSGGELRQIGTPETLYREPADRFVAGFVGEANEVDGATWWALSGSEGGADDALFLVRPEGLRLRAVSGDTVSGPQGAPDLSGDAGLPGRVLDRRFRGPVLIYRVQVEAPGGTAMELQVVGPSSAEGTPDIGDEVLVTLADGATGQAFSR